MLTTEEVRATYVERHGWGGYDAGRAFDEWLDNIYDTVYEQGRQAGLEDR